MNVKRKLSKVLNLPRSAKASGFSLIEVTLAVAIIALGLVAIFGLLPVGVVSSRQVSDETLVSSLAANMLHWRRVTPFASPTWMPPGGPPLTYRGGTNVFAWFDANGRVMTNGNDNFATDWTGPYIKFTYTVRDNPRYPGNLDTAQVVLMAEWPVVNTGTITPAPPVATNLLQRRYYMSQYVRLP